MRRYLKTIYGYEDTIEEYEQLQRVLEEDSHGLYFTSEYEYEKWSEVAEAMIYLKHGGIDYDWHEVDTYNPVSYVRLAESYGFNDYGNDSLRNKIEMTIKG